MNASLSLPTLGGWYSELEGQKESCLLDAVFPRLAELLNFVQMTKCNMVWGMEGWGGVASSTIMGFT